MSLQMMISESEPMAPAPTVPLNWLLINHVLQADLDFAPNKLRLTGHCAPIIAASVSRS